MLSEKLYTLRKKSGLSQEQLAQQLNVSRQAVSKWESGSSIPESDKLLAISEYFHVTLDYLMKEKADCSQAPETQSANEHRFKDHKEMMFGLVICVTGIVGLALWGLIPIWNPSMSDQIGESSVIRVDGNGIFLVICLAAVVVGAGFLLKGRRRN